MGSAVLGEKGNEEEDSKNGNAYDKFENEEENAFEDEVA